MGREFKGGIEDVFLLAGAGLGFAIEVALDEFYDVRVTQASERLDFAFEMTELAFLRFFLRIHFNCELFLRLVCLSAQLYSKQLSQNPTLTCQSCLRKGFFRFRSENLSWEWLCF